MRTARTSIAAALALLMSTAAQGQDALRVCSDPNNLPFSNKAGDGFENAIAEILAEDMQAELVYAWRPQQRGFLRETLKAGKCDVVMGVPEDYEMVDTTRPYYRSAYAFVTRAESGLELASFKDPQLRTLKIGVHLIGDDGVNTPPAHALGQLGIVDNVTGYMIYGDADDPDRQAEIIRAVADGDVDVATVWGPTAGYYAKRSPVPLKLSLVRDTAAFRPMEFQFGIAMGVRHGDDALKARLDDALDRNAETIAAVLRDYGVPRSDAAQIEGSGKEARK